MLSAVGQALALEGAFMGESLSIGRLGMSGIDYDAVSYLDSIGLTGEQHRAWTKCADDIALIDCLNIASVGLFMDHVATLDGFADSSAAIEKSRFVQLPWWESSIWLPVAFAPPTLLDDGSPLFLGSCQALLAELEDVKSLSSWGLGQTPPGYDLMRADIKAFYRSDFKLNDDEPTIAQWIWKALYDGAEIAIRNSAPLSL